MTFTDWPLEIILQVLSDNAIGLHEKCSLARVNRRMQQLALPILYQSIQLHVAKSETGIRDEWRIFLLQRTLFENEEWANGVRSLDFSWEGTPDLMVIDPDLGIAINGILGTVHNLRSLVLEVIGKPRDPYDQHRIFDCPFLVGSNRFHELKQLRLRSLTLEINDVALIMNLPKLDILEVHRLSLPHAPIAEKHMGIRSTVRELHLGPSCKPKPELEHLFWWPTELEKLSYDLGTYMGDGPLSVAPTLSRLLAPQTSTLVSLNLSGADYKAIHRERIDFRHFSRLQHLKIANMLLFPCMFSSHQDQAPFRNGLYERLPNSLETIEILFERGTAIVDPLYSPARNFWIDEDYRWIEELGIHKEEYTPNLRSVILTEHSSCDWGTSPTDPSKLIEWDMPRSVKDAFKGKGVRLEIFVRTEYFLKSYWGPKFQFRPSPRRETPGTIIYIATSEVELSTALS